jgi:NADH-quinone oxidoreductase subunit H
MTGAVSVVSHHAVLALDVGWGTTMAIKTLVILMIIPLGALILGYTFLLKMMSHMQSRLGPMDPGGFHGWFQLVGDGLKFLQKEDIMPGEADRRVFAAAPAVVVLSTFLVFAVIPMGPDLVVKDLDVGVFYALAVSSLSVIGVLMAGWASANKFALLGALRAAAQLIAYELPLILAVVGVVMQAGTMSLQGIVYAQRDGSMFGIEALGNPYIFTQFIGFALFLVAAQAELTQTPFDMPVAESELVSGYMVEYTGFRFLFFFIGEFGTAFAFAALAATLFLGGWSIPGVTGDMANILGPFALFAKLMFVAFLMFWVRFTYPRLREDQLQQLAWKVLIPIGLLNILATGILKVAL